MVGEERFLVTGAMGCIGAWAIRVLLDEAVPVVGFDLAHNPHRLRLIAGEGAIERVNWITGDITDPDTVHRVVGDEGITHIIHLAALQVPFCQADPVAGARVNVVGTINVFEAALLNRDRVSGLAYASSVAAFGPPSLYPGGVIRDDSPLAPSSTIYGVFKQANEWTGKVYAENHELGSVGLRPCVVYGPGRDQGRTSSPTVAMLAAAAGQPYRINHGGSVALQYAEDIARTFVAAARAGTTEALALNIAAHTVSVPEIVAAIEAVVPEARGLISHAEVELPFVAKVEAAGLQKLLGTVPQTPLEVGIDRTIQIFRKALANGMLQAPKEN